MNCKAYRLSLVASSFVSRWEFWPMKDCELLLANRPNEEFDYIMFRGLFWRHYSLIQFLQLAV